MTGGPLDADEIIALRAENAAYRLAGKNVEAAKKIAAHIGAVSAAAQALLAGPLQERALLLLIQDLTSKKIGVSTIREVLRAASELERHCVKPKVAAK